jgi:hypothetical protein
MSKPQKTRKAKSTKGSGRKTSSKEKKAAAVAGGLDGTKVTQVNQGIGYQGLS